MMLLTVRTPIVFAAMHAVHGIGYSRLDRVQKGDTIEQNKLHTMSLLERTTVSR